MGDGEIEEDGSGDEMMPIGRGRTRVAVSRMRTVKVELEMADYSKMQEMNAELE